MATTFGVLAQFGKQGILMRVQLSLAAIGLVLTVLDGSVLAQTQDAKLTQQLTVTDAKQQTQRHNNVIWIDVRTKEEYDSGHLPGAIHIPYEQITDKISQLTQDKNTEIQLYCRSGRRSGIALESLTALGFSKVSNAGGYDALKAKMP
jgi:phage shock protein E